jgi:uncharacterized protein (DUF1501 family)
MGGGLIAGQISFLPRLAEARAANGYQALVCIFMYGGNDGNNTIVPLDPANYSLYQQYRGNLALTAANGNAPLPLAKTSLGLHPALKKTSQLWDDGNLALLLNVGTSIEPSLTVAGYTANPSGPNVPANLFSHEDQRNEWKSAVYQGGSSSGWGGRLASNFAASGDGSIPPMLSFAGPDLFTLAAAQEPLCLPASGSFQINAFPGRYGAAVAAARSYLYAESQTHYRNDAVQAVQSLTASGVAASSLIDPILEGTNASVDPLFDTLQTSIAEQLRGVAKIIAQQSQLGAQIQVFYVDIGNFDTHHAQLDTQQTLLAQLDDAVSAFYAATVALGHGRNRSCLGQSPFRDRRLGEIPNHRGAITGFECARGRSCGASGRRHGRPLAARFLRRSIRRHVRIVGRVESCGTSHHLAQFGEFLGHTFLRISQCAVGARGCVAVAYTPLRTPRDRRARAQPRH